MNRRDEPAFTDLVKRLARYEKLPVPKAAALRRLCAALRRGEPKLHGLIAREGRTAVGYAIYFFTYSSFLARPTLYIEDLFVMPDQRGRGFGKALFDACLKAAKRATCGRMEWAVLTWNKPAQDFYRRAGARQMNAWRVWRLRLRRDSW